jgi:hypothetical protein
MTPEPQKNMNQEHLSLALPFKSGLVHILALSVDDNTLVAKEPISSEIWERYCREVGFTTSSSSPYVTLREAQDFCSWSGLSLPEISLDYHVSSLSAWHIGHSSYNFGGRALLQPVYRKDKNKNMFGKHAPVTSPVKEKDKSWCDEGESEEDKNNSPASTSLPHLTQGREQKHEAIQEA